MTTALSTFKGSGLTKSDSRVRDLAKRLDRARQNHNAAIVRADADYVAAVGRAYEAVQQQHTASADDNGGDMHAAATNDLTT